MMSRGEDEGYDGESDELRREGDCRKIRVEMKREGG
jgi:hypothetical protein